MQSIEIFVVDQRRAGPVHVESSRFRRWAVPYVTVARSRPAGMPAPTDDVSRLARRMLPYVWAHWPRLVWPLVLAMLISVCELLKPWPLKIVIDSVLGGQPLPWAWAQGWSSSAVLLIACGALVVVYAVLGALHMLNNYSTVDVGQRLVTDLRSAVYAHLHQLSRIMAHQYREAVGPWTVFLGVLQCNGHSAG